MRADKFRGSFFSSEPGFDLLEDDQVLLKVRLFQFISVALGPTTAFDRDLGDKFPGKENIDGSRSQLL